MKNPPGHGPEDLDNARSADPFEKVGKVDFDILDNGLQGLKPRDDNFRTRGKTLLENGYLIVPLPKGKKGLFEPGWPKLRFQASDLARHPNKGVGILCGQGDVPIVGVDIDITHPIIGPLLIEWCEMHLGHTAERVGAAPRTLLAFRASSGGWRKNHSIMFFDPADPVKLNGDRNDQKLEILGSGQQFVAYHVHPDTHREYEWVDMFGGLEFFRADDLPVVTPEQMGALLAEVERLVKSTHGVEIKAGARTDTRQGDDADLAGLAPRLDMTIEQASTLMAQLKNDPDDYDTFIETGMAINHQFAGTFHEVEAKHLWIDYGAQSPKHDSNIYDAKWKSFGKTISATPITIRSLIKRLADQKIAEGYAAKTAWSNMLKSTTDELTLREKVCPEIAKDDRLDKIGREDLAQELQAAFKRLGIKRQITVCRELITPSQSATGEAEPNTHHGYSMGFLETLEREAGGHPAIGAEGSFFVPEPSGLYAEVDISAASVRVAKLFDGYEKCERGSDYKAIANHAYSICEKKDFFVSAPVGLASPDGFHQLDKHGNISLEPLKPEHRQRHMHATGPRVGPMPMFKHFLDESFESSIAGEKDQQIAFFQEIVGSATLGLMAKHEKAALFFGPGRSGKGTALKIIEQAVPKNARTSVSPFKWNHEYYLASLAGKRLNLVGELPDDQPLPGAEFKTVTGRDFLTGRNPNHRPFDFYNEAAHIFNSNSYPNTRDHSSAFYNRWLIVSFANSRIGRALIDTDLAAKIVAKEMPAVLAWALEGAQRLVKRGHFQETPTHIRHLAAWQRRTDSVMEFLHDEEACSLDHGRAGMKCKRTSIFAAYRMWCGPAGRKAIGLHKFNDALESPAVAAIGINVKRDPILREVVHGVSLVGSYDVLDGF